MTTYALTFGTLKITGKMVSRAVREEYYADRDGNVFTEYCHVTDKNDASPRVVSDEKSSFYLRYNAGCSACFLGIIHSHDLHNRSIQ